MRNNDSLFTDSGTEMSVKNLNTTTAGFTAVMRNTPLVRKDEYVNLVEGLTHKQDMDLLDFGAGDDFF